MAEDSRARFLVSCYIQQPIKSRRTYSGQYAMQKSHFCGNMDNMLSKKVVQAQALRTPSTPPIAGARVLCHPNFFEWKERTHKHKQKKK